jgi:AraC family transcriptional regulator
MRRETERSYQERLLTVLLHIETHLDEAPPLEELARVACFSPYHFHRIFRGMVGEGVHEYVRRLRLERAAGRLKSTAQPVIRVALDAGYETHEAFTRAFRQRFNMSPTEYRQAQRVEAPSARAADVLDSLPHRWKGERPMDVQVKTIDPIRVAFIRHVGPYAEIGRTWGRLMAWAGPRGVFGPKTRLIGLSHDDPDVTPPERLRCDACVTIPDRVQPQGDVGVQEIAGGEYAMAVHRGPYDTLGQTYAALCGQWAPQHGRELRADPGFEVYLNNPQTTKPADLLTEVYVPLEPRASGR